MAVRENSNATIPAPVDSALVRVLVTGFGPFRGIDDNPSSKLAQSCGAPFKILDVAYAAVDDFLAQLDPRSFDVLLMMGVAAGRDRITPEMFGRNFVGRHPDVMGVIKFGEIDANGPSLLATTLWDARAIADWTMSLPVRASLDAGNYLCNYICYKALERFPEKRVGFLHVPDVDKLPLDTQLHVLRQILSLISGDSAEPKSRAVSSQPESTLAAPEAVRQS